MKLPLILLPVLFLTGCATANPLTSLWTKMFGRKAEAVQTVTVKADKIEDKEVTAAHVEIVKTGEALRAATLEHPESRPVAVATRTNANALALLNQREPLSVSTTDDALALARGLLSVETTARAVAERNQGITEGANRQLSEDLERTRGELKKLQAQADAEARNNLQLANELRTERLMKYGGMALSAVLGLAAIAYRLNIGRFQDAAATVLNSIKTKHGAEAEATARTAFDTVLHTGEQQGVAKALFALTQK